MYVEYKTSDVFTRELGSGGNFTATCNLTVTEKTPSDNKNEGQSNMQQSSNNNNGGSATTKLPQTGSKSIVIFIVIAEVVLVALYSRCKKYKIVIKKRNYIIQYISFF